MASAVAVAATGTVDGTAIEVEKTMDALANIFDLTTSVLTAAADTLTIKIQGSEDNSVWGDLICFSVATGANPAATTFQRRYSGPLPKYIRYQSVAVEDGTLTSTFTLVWYGLYLS